MTNRIDELWGQALDRAVPDTYSSLTWTQVERIKSVFAELIVRECCDVLQNEDIRHSGYGYNQGFLHKKIKEHFGVEE